MHSKVSRKVSTKKAAQNVFLRQLARILRKFHPMDDQENAKKEFSFANFDGDNEREFVSEEIGLPLPKKSTDPLNNDEHLAIMAEAELNSDKNPVPTYLLIDGSSVTKPGAPFVTKSPTNTQLEKCRATFEERLLNLNNPEAPGSSNQDSNQIQGSTQDPDPPENPTAQENPPVPERVASPLTQVLGDL